MRQFSRKELALLAMFAIYNLAIIAVFVLFIVKVYKVYASGEPILLPLAAGFGGGFVTALLLLFASKRVVAMAR